MVECSKLLMLMVGAKKAHSQVLDWGHGVMGRPEADRGQGQPLLASIALATCLIKLWGTSDINAVELQDELNGNRKVEFN